MKATVMFADGSEMVIENVSYYYFDGDFVRFEHDASSTYINKDRVMHLTVSNVG